MKDFSNVLRAPYSQQQRRPCIELVANSKVHCTVSRKGTMVSANPENRPTSTLLEKVLNLSRVDPESDECWDLIWVIRRRGDVETFETAKTWCDSDDVIERTLAANLLGQLGGDNKRDTDGQQVYPFAGQSLPLLDKLLDDPEVDVIDAAITALGHLDLYEPITDRPSLVTHPSADIRYTVACALCRANSEIAIEFLIKLSEDEDEDVRDWATFGLGTQCDNDTPPIRKALFSRLADTHFETQLEAIMGLARRNDSRVIPHIKVELEADGVALLVVDAAGEIASPDLVAPLEQLIEKWGVDTEGVEAALKRCKGESDPENE